MPLQGTLACPGLWHDLHLSRKLHIHPPLPKLAPTCAWSPTGLPQEMVLLSLLRRLSLGHSPRQHTAPGRRVGTPLPAQRQGPGPRGRLAQAPTGQSSIFGASPTASALSKGQGGSLVGVTGPAVAAAEAGMAAEGGRASCPHDWAARSWLGRLWGRRAAPHFPGGNREGAVQAPGPAGPGAWLVVSTWPPPVCGLARRRTEGPGGVTAVLASVCPVTAQSSPSRRGKRHGCPGLRLHPLSCGLTGLCPAVVGPSFTVCLHVCVCFDAGTTLS